MSRLRSVPVGVGGGSTSAGRSSPLRVFCVLSLAGFYPVHSMCLHQVLPETLLVVSSKRLVAMVNTRPTEPPSINWRDLGTLPRRFLSSVVLHHSRHLLFPQRVNEEASEEHGFRRRKFLSSDRRDRRGLKTYLVLKRKKTVQGKRLCRTLKMTRSVPKPKYGGVEMFRLTLDQTWF